MGLSYFTLKQFDEAKLCFNKILELDSNHIASHLQIAEIHKVKGEFKLARERCNKVLKISPEATGAYNKIGELNKLMSSTNIYVTAQ